MTDEDKIKALAELDGKWPNLSQESLRYLTSYDAIIPLVNKQDIEIQTEIMRLLVKVCGNFFQWQATPAQLCDALLRATGKWK